MAWHVDSDPDGVSRQAPSVVPFVRASSPEGPDKRLLHDPPPRPVQRQGDGVGQGDARRDARGFGRLLRGDGRTPMDGCKVAPGGPTQVGGIRPRPTNWSTQTGRWPCDRVRPRQGPVARLPFASHSTPRALPAAARTAAGRWSGPVRPTVPLRRGILSSAGGRMSSDSPCAVSPLAVRGGTLSDQLPRPGLTDDRAQELRGG
jgi:hypothetical protein